MAKHLVIMAGGIGSRFMVRMPEEKQVVIQCLNDCIVAEHDNTLLICKLSEEQRIKEWHD